jgi:hypothetical protein
LFGDDKKKSADRFTYGADKKGVRPYGDFDYNTPKDVKDHPEYLK